MTRTPAQLYALVLGVVLVAVGIVGFAWSASFGTPGESDEVLGLFAVNGWHNLVHLASGALGLGVAGSTAGSRIYALGFGAVYLVVTIWGFALGSGSAILDLVAINHGDTVLHLAIALAGLVIGAISPLPRERRAAHLGAA